MAEQGKINISHDILTPERVYSGADAWRELRAYDTVEIALVTRGAGIHLVLDQPIPCRAGDIFITQANTPHSYLLENEGDLLQLRRLRFFVDESQSGGGADNLSHCYGIFKDGAVSAYAVLNKAMTATVISLFDEISREIDERKKSWCDAVESNLALLLINIERYIDSSIKTSSASSPKEWSLVLAATELVKRSATSPSVTLGTVADSLGISKARLSRIFQRLTGGQFADYLRAARMENAARLLSQSELTVEEIVPASGLRDIPSFYKNFYNHFGMTPSEYRRASKRNNELTKNNNKKSEEKLMVILSEISENLQRGKSKIVKEMVQAAIDEGASPEKILNEGLLHGMSVIGEKFKNNEVYVPEVLVAARAMNMGMQILKPHLAANGVQASGKVCIGTVQGDLHDIGKNLVKMMMEGKGLEVVDLGTDVAPEAFIDAVKNEGCQVICCSALLTTTMSVMADVVKAAEAAGIRDKVKIMIGGAPVNDAYCREIGADCYTADAASAADAAVALCKEA
ncbi:MAG: cobalamin-dependent protein [Clostridia bacterium]|nr:cobalamin-dependent protein [Clostridia bacterium]